ncbi:response regulator [Lutibacter citreus]|uniref:response regulator n=1 Tax=Lutibacter citreus TaxID=2138210 RepID=UPI000DBE2C12|nr:response regulator [Lutibacter citreus]
MKKILLIEDDKVVRENTAELLELANYKVVCAPDGKSGLIQARKHIPDIIICDIMMPELNGYGVLQLLSKDKNTKHIPFIFLSAKTEQKDIRKGMNMGADDYITKPFDESELYTAIESRLAKVAIIKESFENKPINEIVDKSDTQIKNLKNLKKFFYEKLNEYSFLPNEIIYQEGGNSNYIYLVKKGVVKAYNVDEHGKELITALYKESDFFGFTSFSHNIPYQESTTSIEKVQVLRLSKKDLKTILQNNHDVTLELIDFLTDSVSEFKGQLLQMAYSSVRKKTANTILKFTEKIKKKPEDTIKISRSDLASIAGIATETFIRTISDFKKEGLININGYNIEILDLKRLKKVN